MTDDVESLEAHRHAVDATIPLLGAIQSIAEMAYRDAERTEAPIKTYAARVHGLLDSLVASLEFPDREQLLATLAGTGPNMVVAIGSERGLCGAFNEHLVRKVATLVLPDTLVVCWGTRAARLLRTAGFHVALSAPLPSLAAPVYSDLEQMTLSILDLVEEQRVSKVVVVFNAQTHGFQYAATIREILPPALSSAETRPRSVDVKPDSDITNLFIRLITEYVLTELYSAVTQSAITEQLARVAAMRLAIENARKVLDELTAQYNLARQHVVTQSLLEIVTGYQTVVADDVTPSASSETPLAPSR